MEYDSSSLGPEFVMEEDSPSLSHSIHECSQGCSTEVEEDAHNSQTEATFTTHDTEYYCGHHFTELTATIMVGREFGSLAEAQSFFSRYSKVIGFGLRKDEKKRNAEGTITRRRWVCSKQGFRPEYDDNKRVREPRAITRGGCKAAFRVNNYNAKGVWVVTQFRYEHNHELVPANQTQFILSHRKVPDGILSQAKSLHTIGMKTPQIMEYVVEQSGCYENVGFILKDLQNRLDAEAKLQMDSGDFVTALAYLYANAERDPGFYLKYSVDQDHSLANMFWCDSMMKNDYSIFGEVIGFDSTYKNNAYKKPLVVIIGINHHFRTTVFGFALLVNETEETYVWLLESFMQAMANRMPGSVITDSDPAMLQAVARVFPSSTHRLCSWHLAKNAKQNMQQTQKVQGFVKCMKKNQTTEEFEVQWQDYLNEFGIREDSWIQRMNNSKSMWAEAYLRGKFFGKMKANQRCESMNAYLKHFLQHRLKMFQFVRQIDRAVNRIRHVEAYEDYIDRYSSPTIRTQLMDLEQHAAEVLTRRAFLMFREEIQGESLLILEGDPQLMSDCHVYTFSKYPCRDKTWTARFQVVDSHIICSCQGFESDGIPCKHCFAVMKYEQLRKIPPSLLLDRWKKNAKEKIISKCVNVSTNDEGDGSRYGALIAASNKMCYCASKYVEVTKFLLGEIEMLAARVDEMVVNVQGKKSAEEVTQTMGSIVKDPKVVRTKGSGPAPTGHRSECSRRKCSYCDELGHNSRGCLKRKRDEAGGIGN